MSVLGAFTKAPFLVHILPSEYIPHTMYNVRYYYKSSAFFIVLACRYKVPTYSSVVTNAYVHQKPKRILHYTNLLYALSVRAWIYKIL